MNKSLQTKPLSNIELASFCSQLALILQSGISSIEGITIMLEDSTSEEEQSILRSILEPLQETGSLADSLETTQLFSTYMVQMIRIGEETGTLDEVMSALSLHYEREDAISKTIKNAVTYPMIMIGMMVVVILVLIIKVMPIFNQVFIQLGTEMSGFSKALMHLGNTINHYAIFFIVLLLALIVICFLGSHTKSGAAFLRKTVSHFPAIQHIYNDMATCRFASGMALTLKSGMTPEQCMELVCALNNDENFQKKTTHCQQLLSENEEFTDALHKSHIFTGMYARMASIGSKTGNLDQVMSEIAELSQNALDTRMNNALSILEPTLVISLSLVVGVILLSVMLPLVGIMSSI